MSESSDRRKQMGNKRRVAVYLSAHGNAKRFALIRDRIFPVSRANFRLVPL